jgi:hypothetical protein
MAALNLLVERKRRLLKNFAKNYFVAACETFCGCCQIEN